MRKLEALTKKQLIDEVESRVHKAREEFYDQGWQCGFRDCVIRMLDSGTDPRFIAKIIRVDLQHVMSFVDTDDD